MPGPPAERMSKQTAETFSSGVGTSRTTHGTRLLPSCTQSNSIDDLDHGADAWKQECLKLLRELNRELSSYHNLVLGLGARNDGDHLRSELKHCRRRAQEIVKVVKVMLMPLITSHDERDRLELERLWFLFISCLDVLENEMLKTLTLQRMFVLHSDSFSLMNFNVDDLEANRENNLDGASMDSNLENLYVQREELQHLEREIADLKELSHEILHIVDIKPPSIESADYISFPGNNNRLFASGDHPCSLSEASSIVDGATNCQQRCICWIISTIIAVFLLGTILGVCIAFLS